MKPLFQKSEAGSALLFVVIIIGVIGIVVGINTQQTSLKAKMLKTFKKSHATTAHVTSNINRIQSFMKLPSNRCGQKEFEDDPTKRMCPTLFPEPYFCTPDTQLKAWHTGGASWEYAPNEQGEFYIYQDPQYLVRDVYTQMPYSNFESYWVNNQKLIDTRSLPRYSGGLGFLTFKRNPILLAMNLTEIDDFISMSYKDFLATSDKMQVAIAKQKFVFQGFECDRENFPTALFTEISTYSPDQRVVEKHRIKVPIPVPKVSCEVALDSESNLLPKSGGTVDLVLIANGPWREAQIQGVGAEAKNMRLENSRINGTDIAIEISKPLKPEDFEYCRRTVTVSGMVKGVGGDVAVCNSTEIEFDITDADIIANCPNPTIVKQVQNPGGDGSGSGQSPNTNKGNKDQKNSSNSKSPGKSCSGSYVDIAGKRKFYRFTGGQCRAVGGG